MGKRRRLPEELGIFGVLVLVAVVMSFLSPEFMTLGNIQVLMLNGTVVAFLALGQTFVLLTGGIDLSVGSNIALTGMMAALAMRAGAPWWFAALVALAAGVVVGLVNGAIIHLVKLPPFIVTFSTFGICASIPKILTGAQSITVADPMFAVIGRGSLFGIPIPVILLAIVAVIFMVILKQTPAGVHIYAVGGNQDASRLAGVNIGRQILTVYAISGLCAGMGGIITTSRLMVGYPTAGSGNEQFYSIASAVVGGVSLFGGVGSILGALLGAILIATVSNGMNVVGVDSFWQPLVIGVIILVGVSLDAVRRRFTLTEGVGRLLNLKGARGSSAPPVPAEAPPQPGPVPGNTK
ncbi:ABC transporter permease [Propionicimonas sp.]|uniref:ABC transporter permease n=1 Tax=Propionicimonas sp. TaxID=1955623 RepID=UPI0017D82783|nr:ABC transporter permease [Propionicimonas sp.]MBU3976838.1 ABC transporter permease [Actinomycetota bacterium]MBA3019527.1 ABC transporter permease [Propionicimonas sp.]MBU3986933.1 ABC transporter permease [Actinomycetota bacterium]MBU4006845.1 ABC transporter permease [Actinomycetota bacterium]MBU4065545.1 ABC transporter permease [Actinomycetota bacterium]